MLPTMAAPPVEVCAVPRRLLLSGLGFQTTRSINVFFVAEGQTHFLIYIV